MKTLIEFSEIHTFDMVNKIMVKLNDEHYYKSVFTKYFKDMTIIIYGGIGDVIVEDIS